MRARPKTAAAARALGALPLLLVQPAWGEAAPAASRIGFHASLGPEHDSNARRLIDGEPVVADTLLRSTLGGEAVVRLGDHRLSSELNGGAKVFSQEGQENTVVGALKAGYRWQLLPVLAVGADLDGRGRWLRSGLRDYLSGQADLVVEFLGLAPLALQLRAGPAGFLYAPAPSFSNAGLVGALWASLRPWRREQLALGYEADGRQFPAARVLTAVDPDGSRTYGPGRRGDLRHIAAFQITSARSLFITAGYAALFNQSTNLGEIFLRHRLHAVVGAQLPLSLFASLSAGLQITRYPQGMALSQHLLLEDSDESQNHLVLTLRRPITGDLSLEGRLGLYSNELSDSGIAFARATSYVGVVYHAAQWF